MSVVVKLVPKQDSHSPPRATAVLTPFWDCFCVGGLAVALYLLFAITLMRNPPDPVIGLYVFNLCFIFNFPHFLASYQLLYSDFRREIFKNPRYLWAAVGAPALLLAVFAYVYAQRSPIALGYILNAMYLLVGWHYVRQTFGIMVVTNSIRGYFYSKNERVWLQANMFSLWFLSVISMNVGSRALSEFGALYFTADFPEWWRTPAYVAVSIAGAGFLISQLRRYIRDGGVGSPASWIAYATIYVFMLPAIIHPFFMHLVPLFHSLQYMLFVYAFRRNKVVAVTDERTPDGRRERVFGVWGYLAGSVILGAFGFYIIPSLLDLAIDGRDFGGAPFMLMFTAFLNIHHYFIDNAIWRGDNEDMRRHLFQTAA